MKEKLLELIGQISDVETLFHKSSGIGTPQVEIIYDVQEFKLWLQAVKFELTEIHKRTKEEFIRDTLNDIRMNFRGWHDRDDFNTLKGDLTAIKDNIDSYYPQDKSSLKAGKVLENTAMKNPKIFISHSSKDVDYATQLVTLFEDMGLNDDQIFCSSVPGYDIPLDKDIFEYLREQFLQYKLHVIFVLSPNYYDSKISLNEMGAAWALRTNNTSILLPGFDFSQMEGVIGKDKISIKLDKSDDEMKDKLNQLYSNIVEEFGLTKKRDVIWERKRDSFISEIKKMREC